MLSYKYPKKLKRVILFDIDEKTKKKREIKIKESKKYYKKYEQSYYKK